MRYFSIILILISLLLFGCGENYSKYPNQNLLPQHIKKIAVAKFKNDGQNTAFQDKLYFTIVDRFTTDRRVEVADFENADAVLIGNVSRYFLQPLEYDSNKKVTKYLLWVWVDISLYDSLTKKILWTENHLEAKVEYSTLSSTNTSFMPTTEIEAQDVAIDKLADSVVGRTIDGWFSVSGATETIYS